ncbi:MAG: T9SS type A sorting domain-containing protein, partial [Bacteroidota bacterium]
TPEAGGSYEIDMDISFGLAGNFNAQLAVYEATDCTDFSTFTLLQADDLNIVEERFSVSLFPKEDVFCLEGNTTYYVLVDGGTDIFGSPTRSEGLFQLQINTKELAPVTAQTYTQGQLCEGEAAGTAIVAGQGGAGEYTYEWSTGATTPDLVYSLESGDYTVTITDQCGDEGVQSITVPAFYRPELAVNLADRTACEGEEVSLAPAVTGGIPLESFRVFTKSPFNLFLGDLTVPFLKETVAERISFEGELAIFREMEMIRGELYSLGRFNQLYLIDVENETVTQVDSIDLPPLRDLSYVSSTDQVYTVTNDGTVYELDIENGTNTLVVNPELPLTETQQIRHAAVDQDGVVYYLTQDFFVEGGTWYAMPLSTGVADSIGRFEGNVFLVDAIEIDPFDNSLYHTLEEFQSLALSVHYIVKVDKSNGQEIDRFDDVQADLITAMAIADRPADEPLYDYLWTPEAAFENPTALTQSLVATEEVTYTFSASDFCGTAAQEELTLEVLPVTNVTIDTSILRGETYNGIVIETDTIIFESATTATACENRRVNISVIISSTDQIQAERLVRISPNPTSQILNVSLDGLFSHTPIQLSILDVHGRMIWQQNRQDLQSTIAVGDFQKGLYFLEVRTAEQVVVRQFVKL